MKAILIQQALPMLHHVQCWVKMGLAWQLSEGKELLQPRVGEGWRMGVVVGGGGRQWCLWIFLIQWQGLQWRGRVAGHRRFYSCLPASVDAMSPFHVLIVIWPIGKMVLTLQARVRPLTCMLPSVSLKKKIWLFCYLSIS